MAMPARIQDYALIGDCETAALVARDGSMDWLCLPRFDSGACFAALLGGPEHGRWLIAPPAVTIREIRRCYRGDSLILETTFETEHGAVTLIDFMPVRMEHPVVARIARCDRGQVPLHMQLVLRFDYGSIAPWIRRTDYGIWAIAGPDALQLRTSAPLRSEDLTTVADFTLAAGDEMAFTLTWYPSHEAEPSPVHAVDPAKALRDTEAFWKAWVDRCTYAGDWRDAVVRSLITLKALTYLPTGGIVAAATTSLPEDLGGPRNWDYRFCWLRDATFTLYSLINCGYYDEALAWGNWLLRAAAGKPDDLQIMYGIAGERRLNEFELPWLPGYEGSRPVRIGNAAADQFQLDVYGEVLDVLFQCRRHDVKPDAAEWSLERALVAYVEAVWRKPDRGIWEIRGEPRHFTASKVMAWVALDRAIKNVEMFGLEGPIDHWKALRRQIHDEVCHNGFDAQLGSFVQSYASRELDASLLLLALVGFLPPTDERIRGTVTAIEKHLSAGGFIRRYDPQADVDHMHTPEGAFLVCSFWMADNLALIGRMDDARRLFERLLGLRNDVGLLSEEFDVRANRLVGNFPQAFSHIGIINTACHLSQQGPARRHDHS